MKKILKISYSKFWVPVMGRIVSKLIPLLEGKPPEKSPTYDIDDEKLKWGLCRYSGNEPPWQYPTAIEFISILFFDIFLLLYFRYFVVFSIHEALDEVYLTIGYMYNITPINIAE